MADFNQLAYVISKPACKAILKANPADFIVEEQLGYELTGSGEHLWCWVEKQGQNTDWVAGQLAKWANTSKRNVGFAGQKDRHAVTRQWFSVHLPGKADPSPQDLQAEGVKVLALKRHSHKLQRGELAGNAFTINLTQVQALVEDKTLNALGMAAQIELCKQEINARLEQIKHQGFANYFGQQRFGWQGNNLVEATKLFEQRAQEKAARLTAVETDKNDNLDISKSKKRRNKKRTNRGNDRERNQQSMYISAVRSWMFNELLSQRIEAKSWNTLIAGDVIHNSQDKHDLKELLDPTNTSDVKSATPSGLLFGDGPFQTQDQALQFEENIAKNHPVWMAGLCDSRIKVARRAFVVMPKNLSWQWQTLQNPDIKNQEIEAQESDVKQTLKSQLNLQLSFELPAGSFATMLLREVVQCYEPQRRF